MTITIQQFFSFYGKKTQTKYDDQFLYFFRNLIFYTNYFILFGAS